MNAYKKYLILVILFSLTNIFAQNQKDALEKYKSFAKLHIDSLKNNGCTIVILKSKTRAIEAYEKSGNIKLANEMIANIQLQNKRMMNAYKTFWDFNQVYYMYAKDLENFNQGKRDSIFIDSTMSINNTIKMNTPFYIFIDYGTFYEVQNKSHDSAPSKWKNNEYCNFDPSEGVPVKGECLIVKDKLMRQYRYPFPDYCQTWGNANGIKKAISTLNLRFNTTYIKGFDINAAF